MDVDLLRPGTVPIAPETILWFEFLLDKDLLLKHLQKEYPDPSSTDLIVKFYSVIGELYRIEKKSEENNEGPPGHNDNLVQPKSYSTSLKVIALKVLALKVAAYLQWDLNALCMLPMKVQINLIQDLLQFTNNQWTEAENIYEYNKDISQHHLFALILYHRWVIKTCFEHSSIKSYPKYNNNDIGLPESIIYPPETVEKSLTFVMEALNWGEMPNFITYDTFIMPTEINNEVEFDWDKTITIPNAEFQAQLHYDLGTYNFFKENYCIAIPYFINTVKFINETQIRIGFLSVKNTYLEGFLIASNSKNGHKYSLTKQLKISAVSHFVGLLNIFLQDNVDNEIPLVYRINVEINIRSALSCGKFTVARDLLPKVQALNTIRFVMNVYNNLNMDSSNLELLSWSILKIWDSLNNKAQDKIKAFIIEYFTKNKLHAGISKEAQDLCALLDRNDMKYVNSASEETDIPQLLQKNDWNYYELNVIRNPYLEIKLLEERIISSYNPDELRELLVKLTMRDKGVNITKINSKWELPIPLQSVIMAIPRGFLQDFGYIILAKSKELMLGKDWNLSINLLNVLYNEVQNNQTSATTKLARLIKLEILLVQINELFESWPALHLDRKMMYHDCESCLKMNESVLPRSEIIEQCILCLINLNHWDFVTNPDKLWNNFEIAIALAATCQELIKYKCVKKSLKDLWELILPIFMVPSQTKRSSTGTQTVIHRDALQSNAKLRLLSLFYKLRDSTALTVIISLLAKLYNILKDEATLELYIDYVSLWPAVISNANSYGEANVLETLTKLVLQALQYYPTNVSFLRLMGDINFANLNVDGAINYYLKYILVSTDYFNMPVRPDDVLFRRLIKCCVSLNCHTQAAVFCQFLDDPDYMQAFRSLSEQKSCFDTVDGYYHCFWDVNILEFLIYHHHKRTELKRKKHAIQTIGLLELNASNNEEIQHEASSIRKKTFLQAMCRQFISF